MAYSDFSLERVKSTFGLTIEEMHLFAEVQPVSPSSLLQSILEYNVEIAAAIGTEKAKSELIIAPVLLEVKRTYNIGFFSGKTFTVDQASGLNGECDFILSASPIQSLITAPVLTVVEAKNDNILSGLGQCVAQMLGAWTYNQREGTTVERIYGAVSTGTNWKFLTLRENNVEIDLTEYFINQVGHILGILSLPFLPR